jgi:hypothetical protein
MPLLKGKENIGHNVETEEAAGKSKAQSVAIALKTAGVPKAKDIATVTTPNAAAPSRAKAEDGSYSVGDMWPGKRS